MREIRILLVLAALIPAGCATNGSGSEETDPTVVEAAPDPAAQAAASILAEDPKPQEESKQQESEVPIAVAETEKSVPEQPDDTVDR